MALRLLLVDSDEHDRALAAAVLAKELPDAGVTEAATAASYAEALARGSFDVVVCEAELGWTEGEALLSGIREKAPGVPVVFFTRRDDLGEAVRVLKAGAADYLVKSSQSYVELPGAVEAAWCKARESERRRRSETRLQRLMERSRLGVFRATLDRQLVEASPAFLRILGVGSLEEALELELPELYFSSRRRSELLRRLDDRGELRAREVELKRADGRRLWVNLTELLLVDAEGDVVIDGLVEDITEIKRRQERLQARIQELEVSAEELREFSYLVAHELQQPLRMMERYTQLLEEEYLGRIESEADEYIGFAVDGARTMQRIIDDLLVLSRVSAEERKFRLCECEEILDRAIRSLWRQIEESGARLERQPLPTVLGEAGQLVQLFQNLIGNALKFHGEAPPVVRIDADRREDVWVFSVADNGIGVPPDQIERVFEIFKRLHPEYEGTGVGLAVCRRIVERHGGEIWIESSVGHGTTVRFSLPWPAPEEMEEAEDEALAAGERHE